MRRKPKAQLADAEKCPADGGEHRPSLVLRDSVATRPCHVVTTRYSAIKACHHARKCTKCQRILAWSIPGDQCPNLNQKEANP